MFKDRELNNIINCLECKISSLEKFLDQYKGYLSQQEIKAKIEELQELKLLQVKTEYIISNKALAEVLG